MTTAPSIAIIGGSGLYRLFESDAETQTVATPYGSVEVTVGELSGKRVAFFPRHGVDHSVAPHLIDARANLWAVASLGVRVVLTTAAVGGIHPDYPSGTLAIPDQFIDRTWGRPDTYYDHGSVQHLQAADPFDRALREVAMGALADDHIVPRATVVVVQGPRFSTRAESRWFAAAGAHLVNMTLYPEIVLAAELNLGYLNLSFVTDADAGDDAVEGDDDVSAELVFARLADAQPRIRAALAAIVAAIPDDYRPATRIADAEVAAVLARPTS
ncbi:S-methyl-5'-thioadenosine phosphorylase [soil metagenome]